MDDQEPFRAEIVAALAQVREAYRLPADPSSDMQRLHTLSQAARVAAGVKQHFWPQRLGVGFDASGGLLALDSLDESISQGSTQLERAIGHLARALQWLVPEPGFYDVIIARCRASANPTLLTDDLHNRVETWLHAMAEDLRCNDMM